LRRLIVTMDASGSLNLRPRTSNGVRERTKLHGHQSFLKGVQREKAGPPAGAPPKTAPPKQPAAAAPSKVFSQTTSSIPRPKSRGNDADAADPVEGDYITLLQQQVRVRTPNGPRGFEKLIAWAAISLRRVADLLPGAQA